MALVVFSLRGNRKSKRGIPPVPLPPACFSRPLLLLLPLSAVFVMLLWMLVPASPPFPCPSFPSLLSCRLDNGCCCCVMIYNCTMPKCDFRKPANAATQLSYASLNRFAEDWEREEEEVDKMYPRIVCCGCNRISCSSSFINSRWPFGM